MEKIKLNAIGDSIIAGFGVEGNSFINISSNNIEVNNYGINGNTSEDVLQRIEDVLDCDILLLFYGLNDFLEGKSVKSVLDNTIKILNIAQNEVILCVPYKVDTEELMFLFNPEGINRKIKELNHCYKKLDYKCKILSFYDLYDEQLELFDGIHPTEKSHNKMKDSLLKFIEVNYGIY